MAMLISGVLSILLTPFLVHGLGDYYYGLWVLVTAVLDYYGLLDLGMRSTLHSFVGRQSGSRDRAGLNQVLSTALALTIGIALLLFLAIPALLIILPPLFGISGDSVQEFRKVVGLYALTVAVLFPARGLGAYLCGLQRFDLYNGAAIVAAIVRAGCLFLALLTGHGVVAVTAIGLGTAVLSLGLNLAAIRLVDAGMSLRWRHVSIPCLRSLLAYSFSAFLNTLGDYLRLFTQPAVIASRLTMSLVTHFNVAAILMSYFRQIVAGLAGPLLPRLSELDGQHNPKAFRHLFLASTRITVIVSLYLSTMFVFNGDSLFNVWLGSRFASSYSILVILTVGFLATLSQYPAVVVLYARNQHQALGWWTLLEGALNIALSWIWAPKYGLVGVAWATTLPMLFTSLFVLPWYATRCAEITLVSYLRVAFARPFLVVLCFSVIAMAMRTPGQASGPIGLAFTLTWHSVVFWILMCAIASTAGEQSRVWKRVLGWRGVSQHPRERHSLRPSSGVKTDAL